ncbi:MAG TPA: hypothetical protein VEJ68_01885 [Candidatus Bathyarchaeia archaeon]|nr:hypothetical protein [Candidatus Bathyarchaeia archaeon]
MRTIGHFIRYDDVLETVMNIYDKKSVRCSRCDKFIGEIDYDAIVTLPKCGRCANPLPEGDDKIMYVVSKFNKNPQILTKPLDPTLA